MYVNKILSASFFCCSIFFYSCTSFKQPDFIEEPLNYTDQDILNSEITRINSWMESEPVRALWRSVLTGNEEVINRTIDNVVFQFDKAMEEKNYFEAKKYYKSLQSVGWKSEKYTSDSIEKLISTEVPGLSGNKSKTPSRISECMDATVTVWVDRGIKVQNGAGYADIILGSGFFIDERGYIVTNHHVIDSMVNPKYEGYSRLYVKLLEDPDTKIPAKVIGYDSVLDLALLKTEIVPKTILELGSSSDLQIGDKVSAIGTPVGLEGTLTSGIISSTERKLFTLGNVFQIDAAVNSGNSGGPLVDENMKVQAVVFAGMPQYQGLNFAIPVEYLRQELNLMYSCGEVIHPWVAAFGHTKRQGTKKAGLEVQYVLPGGSASMTGLKVGDVIIEVDGNKITSLEDFQFLLMAYESETLLKCKYIDANEDEKSCLLYLERRPENPNVTVYDTDFARNAFLPLFGMSLIPSSTTDKNSYTIDTVIKGSTADEMSFSQYDLITIKNVKVDMQNEYITAQLYAQRKKKGFLDIMMVVTATLDSPFYF